jgi:hypothetical protein
MDLYQTLYNPISSISIFLLPTYMFIYISRHLHLNPMSDAVLAGNCVRQNELRSTTRRPGAGNLEMAAGTLGLCAESRGY